MMEVKKYNYTMGILSCIGIVCVVMGHMGCKLLTVDNWFYYYSFHMPLFVFISGYFYDSKNKENILGYIGKKIKKLIVPFYITALIYLLLHSVLTFYGFSLGLEFSVYNWLIYPWLNDQSPGFNVACWFMIALFLVNVTHAILSRCIGTFIKEERFDFTILLVYIAITIAIVTYRESYTIKGFKLVFLRSMFLMSFYQLGYCYKKYFEVKDNLSNIYYFIICLGLRFLITVKYGPSDYAVYNISFGTPGHIVFLAALLGIAFWLRIAKILTPILNQSKLAVYIGQHTMEIMAHHLFALFIIQLFFYYCFCCRGLFPEFDIAAFKSNVYYKYIPIENMKLFYSVCAIGIVLAGSCLRENILVIMKNRFRKNDYGEEL